VGLDDDVGIGIDDGFDGEGEGEGMDFGEEGGGIEEDEDERAAEGVDVVFNVSGSDLSDTFIEEFGEDRVSLTGGDEAFVG